MNRISFLKNKHKYFDAGAIDINTYQAYHDVPEEYRWVKTIFVFGFGYQQPRIKTSKYISAKFAYGEDYHQVIKKYLEEIISSETLIKVNKYEIKVDNNPFFEKVCAYLAGIGNFGKNNLIISPRFGTFMNLGVILSDLKLKKYSTAVEVDPCGDCTLCIKACPTNALDNGFERLRCLSYLTQYQSVNYDLYDKIRNVFVGCDLCQEACPYNNQEYPILPQFKFNDLSIIDLEDFKKNVTNNYKKYYANKTFNWIGFLKMLRNILVLEVNNKNVEIEKLNYYQKKFKNEQWFVKHLDYLKEKLLCQ